ncbi:MAG: hypothetical protein E6H64_17960, partial [Betaproteobacteria bacterium]
MTQQPTPSAPTLAPGTPAGTIVSAPSYQAAPTSAVPVVPPTPTQTATQAASAAAAAAAATRALTTGDGSGVIRNVQVVADKDNNTVLIVATPTEYAVIEAALKKLDVPQRQVAIEVTIASVVLNDSIQFGVEWLFKG